MEVWTQLQIREGDLAEKHSGVNKALGRRRRWGGGF